MHTVAPHSRRRVCVTCSTASNAPTASSSTLTSGCSPRSTPAHCSIATRLSPRAAHTQHAEYLDVLHDTGDEPWNASDYAHHLSRRARGLPLWFSLATHGTDAYTEAVEITLRTAQESARLVEQCPVTELLMEPELSVVVFRRIGWTATDYQAWSDAELAAGRAFVVPTTWQGEVVLRICIVNPLTTADDIASMLAGLGDTVS